MHAFGHQLMTQARVQDLFTRGYAMKRVQGMMEREQDDEISVVLFSWSYERRLG